MIEISFNRKALIIVPSSSYSPATSLREHDIMLKPIKYSKAGRTVGLLSWRGLLSLGSKVFQSFEEDIQFFHLSE